MAAPLAVEVAVVASESTPSRGAGICMSSLDEPSHLSLMAHTDEGRSAHLLCRIQEVIHNTHNTSCIYR